MDLFRSSTGPLPNAVTTPILALAMFLVLTTLSALAHAAGAENYPNRPIKLIVPFPPAGTTDIVGRTLAEFGGQQLGQRIIVDNRIGAGGNAGTELGARAAPDGYTLVLCTIGTCASNASVYSNMTYDVERDFAPIILVGSVINILGVTPSLPAKNVKELVDLAKQKPGGLNFGSSGFGSSPHFSGEIFKHMAQIDMVHVPYKGSAPALIDLRSGQIQLFFDNAPSILPQIQSGAIRALAVTGVKRTKTLPNVPTMEESGYAGFVITPWWGVLAPAKTPRAIIDKLNAAFNATLKDPRVVKLFTDAELEIAGGKPEQLAQLMKSETARFAKIAKERGIRAE